MSGEGVIPFSSEKLASLGALAQSIHAMSAPAPIDVPAVVNEHGYICFPAADEGEAATGHFLHAGIRLTWVPARELGGLVLVQLGGLELEDGFEEEGVTSFLTFDEMRKHIADLQAILAAAGVA